MTKVDKKGECRIRLQVASLVTIKQYMILRIALFDPMAGLIDHITSCYDCY